MTRVGLFAQLLANDFAKLGSRVREAHGGDGAVLTGVATIERGSSWLAQCMCFCAGLPRNQTRDAVTVTIESVGSTEIWTRLFASSRPMRSTLRANQGLLVERLGALTMSFGLHEQGGNIVWALRKIALLGIPLPVQLFQVESLSGQKDEQYYFEVSAALIGIGLIIRYEGLLHLTQSTELQTRAAR